MKNKHTFGGICILSLVFIAVGSFLIVNYLSNHLTFNNYIEIAQTNPNNIETSEEGTSSLHSGENTDVNENHTKVTEPRTEAKSSYVIDNFESIIQTPELPTGCEITALTMVLNYYGYDADKVVMATEYLPIVPTYFYYDSEGNLYGPDLNNYFIGDPTTTSGYICGTGAITPAADDYLEDVGSSMRAVDMTGSTPEELYQLVSEDTPVVVWVTIYMVERSGVSGWYTESGEYVDWSTSDHGAVLIGYSEDTVTIADPISGIVEYDRAAFESVFESRGNKCVILE